MWESWRQRSYQLGKIQPASLQQCQLCPSVPAALLGQRNPDGCSPASVTSTLLSHTGTSHYGSENCNLSLVQSMLKNTHSHPLPNSVLSCATGSVRKWDKWVCFFFLFSERAKQKKGFVSKCSSGNRLCVFVCIETETSSHLFLTDESWK